MSVASEAAADDEKIFRRAVRPQRIGDLPAHIRRLRPDDDRHNAKIFFHPVLQERKLYFDTMFFCMSIFPIVENRIFRDQFAGKFGIHFHRTERRDEISFPIDRRAIERDIMARTDHENIVIFFSRIDLIETRSRNASGKYITGMRRYNCNDIGNIL